MGFSGISGKAAAAFAALLCASAAFAALPSGYTALEYIQGTGDAGAYICASDIYINPQTDKIVTTFEVGSLSSGNGYAIWCARTTWDAATYSLLWSVNKIYNKFLFQAAYSSTDGSYADRNTDPAVANTVVTVTAESNSWNVSTESGVEMSRTWPTTLSSSFTQTGGPLFLFAGANGTTVSGFYSDHKLYSFKIYTRSGDDYTLSHDLVPAKRKSDGHIGLYDDAAGKFYANSGSGAFVAGPEVSDEFSVSPIPDVEVDFSSLTELFDSGIEPTVTVSNLTTMTELVLGTDYTVAYSGNTAVGTATATVTGLGEYSSHTAEKTFAIAISGQSGTTTYYSIPGANDSVLQSSITGTSSSRGWATTKGSMTKAVSGITDANGLYVVWTDSNMRTPDNAAGATAGTAVVLVEPDCTWSITDKLGANTLTISNVNVRSGAAVVFSQVASNYSGTLTNTIAGSFHLADGASLHIDSSYKNCYLTGNLDATVTGTGAIKLWNSKTSGDESTHVWAPGITGDLSGFKGDLVTFNGATNGTTSCVLELVNAESIPGDPDSGNTACVVVTNGATLAVDHDWVSPKNRTWIFGDGMRPTVKVPADVTLTINGELVGSSGFVKTGAGTLVLTKSSPSFSGDCEVVGGKVRLEKSAASLAGLFRSKKSLTVPLGYTILDSLSLSGGGTASYIDTGYTPASGTVGFLLDYLLEVAPSSSASRRVMGSSANNGGKWGGLFMSTWVQNASTQSGQFGLGDYAFMSASGGQVANERMRVGLFNGSAQFSRGWSSLFSTNATYSFNGSIYIGTIHTETLAAGAPMSVYRYKIFEGSTLVHDFVPVQRTSDGAVGLYDTFGNLGFRPGADARYVSAGQAYAGSDSEWLEVASPAATVILMR